MPTTGSRDGGDDASVGPVGAPTVGHGASSRGSGGALGGALAGLAEAVAEAAALVSWQRADDEVLQAVRGVAVLRSQVEALYLDLVRELDGRSLATSSPVATTPEGFLRAVGLTGAGQARRDVAAARATAPGRPLEPFAAELAAGRRTRAHVDVAVRVLDRVPASVLERPGAPDDIVAFLRSAADDATPLDMDRAARQLLARLDPDADAGARFDPDGHTRRFLDVHTDATGMVVGSFQLDAVSGATVRAAIDAVSAPEPGADGSPDRRQPRQRRADALVRVAETALGVSVPRRGERPRVVVHLTPDQLVGVGVGLGRLETGDTVSRRTARRLSCDAVLQRVVSTPSLGPLDVGREHRLVTLAQRRALAARDGGCVVPGCGAPPDWCDAHHVVHWADGGPSDIGNYVLLCPAHHTAVHAGTWVVEIRGGQVVVTPPRWVDPTRTPRPARHQRVERLLHALDGGADPAPGGPGADRTDGEVRATSRWDALDELDGEVTAASRWDAVVEDDGGPAPRPPLPPDVVQRLLLSEGTSARRRAAARPVVPP